MVQAPPPHEASQGDALQFCTQANGKEAEQRSDGQVAATAAQ